MKHTDGVLAVRDMDVATLLLLWLLCVSYTCGQLLHHSKSPRREILSYRSYKDVTILPYHVPEQSTFATFNFTVNEEIIYAVVNKCPPRNVTVVLKAGSFAVVNPDGAIFPEDYVNQRIPQHTAQFLSDSQFYMFNITNPAPGDWFALIFLSYTNPNNDKILQQGLSSSCIAIVDSSMDVIVSDDVTQLVAGQPVNETVQTKDGNEIVKNYKFFVPEYIWKVQIDLRVGYCKGNCPPLNVAANAYSIPIIQNTGVNYNNSLQIHCSSERIEGGDECVLKYMPSENSWNYLTVASIPSKKSRKSNHNISYEIEVIFEYDNSPSLFNTSAADECVQCWPRVPLVRQSYPAFFMYNFVRVPYETGKPVASMNLTTESPTLMKFEVFPIRDVGGTLTFELRLDRDVMFDNITDTLYNVSIVSCLSYQSRSEPVFPDKCVSNSGILSSLTVRVNTSKSYTGKIHVPYPEPGQWYISLKPFCYTDNGNTSVECTELNYTTVSFIIDSDSCGPDNCGSFGHCFNYMSGGVIFSTCVCDHGYSGWACTDDSKVVPLGQLLTAALLLTLSNLLFLPAIIVSVRRRLWTEAFVYCCTMFFSTFYHACEAGEDVYSYCIMRLGVLQFCDFYTAILALWVTVLAMAGLPPTARSLAHMVGAVGIALGTEYDRTSLAVFMIPTLIGVAILIFQWGSRCRRQRSCYPHKKYWTFCFPPGILLVLLGISCYSFLQTRNNYKYVHSAWHAIMAVSIVFLLPMRKYSILETEESDYSLSSSRPFWVAKRFWLCKICRRN